MSYLLYGHRGCFCKELVACGRQWHPTPVLLPGESHGRRSLEGCSPRGRWGSDTTDRLHFFHFLFMLHPETHRLQLKRKEGDTPFSSAIRTAESLWGVHNNSPASINRTYKSPGSLQTESVKKSCLFTPWPLVKMKWSWDTRLSLSH